MIVLILKIEGVYKIIYIGKEFCIDKWVICLIGILKCYFVIYCLW